MIRVKSVFVAGGLSATLATLLTLLLLSANYLSALLPRQPIHQKIEQAFARGDLGDPVHLRTNTKQGAHQYNDCLILSMASDDRPAPLLRALSPVTPAEIPENNPCLYLRMVSSGSPAVPLSPATFYHRYLHGQVAVTALLLQRFDLAGIRTFYDLFAFTILIGLVGANLHFLRSSLLHIKGLPSEIQLQRATRHGVLLLSSIIFLLFYGVQFYGMSLGHGPSDVVLYGYLLTATFVNFSDLSGRKSIAIHSAFGVFTAYFELFTGGVPLGLSLIFICYGSLALGSRRFDIWWNACLAAGAFLCAFVIAVITKLVVAGCVFGFHEVFANFVNQLQFWTEGDRIGVIAAAIALAESSHYLGGGWRLLGAFMLSLSGVAFVYSIVVLARRIRHGENWESPSLFVLAYMAIIVWYIVFRKHAAQHNFFMIRISVGLIISSLALLAYICRAQFGTLMKIAGGLAYAGGTPVSRSNPAEERSREFTT